MNAQSVHVIRVNIGSRLRRVDRAKVKAMAESLAEIGLINPITVQAVGDEYRLVAGRHRLEAAKLLGWDTVPAVVVELDDVDRLLAEIDENLIRNDLSDLERSEHLAERKRLYLLKHPETAPVTQRGGPGRGQKTTADSATVSFTADTAAKTGASERAVRVDVQIAESIPEDVHDAIRDTPIAESKTDLLDIARLPEAAQREVIATADLTTIDAPSVRLMTAAEARACVEQIREGIENIRVLALELQEREGWRALGYTSWRACAAAEFGKSEAYVYRLADAARIDRIISPIGENAPIPESHARELAPLKDDPEAVRTVYAEVRDVTGGKPTQRDVREGVDRHLSRPARPTPKTSAATKRVAEPELNQDIPDDLATAGADVDPAHEFPFNNEPAVAPKAEQWCQTCGEKYRGDHSCDEDEEPYPRGADIACSRCGGGILVNTAKMDRALARVVAEGRHSEVLCLACPGADTVSWRRTVDVEPTAAASAASNEVEKEEERRRDDWRPVRSAISDPTPARRTGADGGSVIYVDATAGAITRALFSHGGGIAAIVDAIAEEAPQEQYVALVGLMSERLPIEQARALYRRLDTRIRVHNDRQTALHLTGKAS